MAAATDMLVAQADGIKTVLAGRLRCKVDRIDNTIESICAFFDTLSGQCSLLLEATGNYHLLLATTAHAAGHKVYVVDGFKVSRYRKSIGTRVNTDLVDSVVLLSCLQNEADELRQWTPPRPDVLKISTLLNRRAELGKLKVAAWLSLDGVPDIDARVATS